MIALGGSVLFNRKFARAKFIERLKDLQPTTIAMEVCGTAHFWARKLQADGHTVQLILAQHVKAFCRVHKSDSGDALAITEAAGRPKMHCVAVKSLHQQDLQMLNRVRSKAVAQRTELISQARGLASEYGVTIPTSRAAFMRHLPLALLDLKARRGHARAIVALANKLARIGWARAVAVGADIERARPVGTCMVQIVDFG